MYGISEIVTFMVFVWLIVNMDLPPVSVCCIINVQWLALYLIFDNVQPLSLTLQIETLENYASLMTIGECE